MKSKSMTEAFKRWSKCSCSQRSQCRCNHLNWWLKSSCSHETDDWSVVAIIKLMIEEFMQLRMKMTENFLIRSLNVTLAWDQHSLRFIDLDFFFSLFITSSMCLIFSCSLHFFSSACFVVSSLILQNTFNHWLFFSALLVFCYIYVRVNISRAFHQLALIALCDVEKTSSLVERSCEIVHNCKKSTLWKKPSDTDS